MTMTEFRCAAHALIRNEGNKILLLKRSDRNDYKPGYWDIPGGTVEAGETVEEALKREAKEEIGAEIDVKGPLFVFTNKDQLPKRQTIQIVYECIIQKSVQLQLCENEHSLYRWVETHDLGKYKLIAFVKALSRTDVLENLGAPEGQL